MSSVVNRLFKKKLINPPGWLPSNTMFEGQTGSVAYGAVGESSDIDVVGFCIPPKDLVFPHLSGEIPGFGRQISRFEQFQAHHISDQETRREYDITVYSIVKFFQLTMENNPNMVDLLFLPRRCVLHSTSVYEHVRDHRHLFLHRGSYYEFRGYAASQLSKLKNGASRSNIKRRESYEKNGMDTKFAYHLVRLLLECEQILTTGDLRLDRDSKIYQSIRRGEWSEERLTSWFENKEKSLETLYSSSKLPDRPPEDEIKKILLECMEMHYGNLTDAVVDPDRSDQLVRELQELVKRYS